MPRKISRRVVVDASVLAAAGNSSDGIEPSRICRRTLDALLKVCHRVGASIELEKEWKDHSSLYSSTWMTAMESRDKLIRLGDLRDEAFRRRVLDALDRALEASALAGDDAALVAARRCLEKDCHLLEAAVQLDRVIISLDRRSRRLAREAAAGAREIRTIVWLDPSVPFEDVEGWIESGARTTTRPRLADSMRTGE